jgi:bacillithiol biosynthesis deacetylase BshB1
MKNNLKLDALFIGAHPDDIEITSSGTLLRLIDSGRKAGIVDLTQGELSTRGTLKSRAKETAAATKILGAAVRENLKLKDGNIENNPQNRLKLIRIIRRYKPEIIFAPYPNDRHPDHISASNFIKESVYYSGLRKINTEGLDAFRPKRIYYFRHAYDLPVSIIVDISSTFEKKMKSILAYSSQFYNPKATEPETYISSSLFLKDVEAKARFYGFKIGAEFGEPFYTEEPLNIEPDNLLKI